MARTWAHQISGADTVTVSVHSLPLPQARGGSRCRACSSSHPLTRTTTSTRAVSLTQFFLFPPLPCRSRSHWLQVLRIVHLTHHPWLFFSFYSAAVTLSAILLILPVQASYKPLVSCLRRSRVSQENWFCLPEETKFPRKQRGTRSNRNQRT